MQFIDLSGQRFGKLLVLHRVENRGRRSAWACECECGSVTPITGSNLRRSNSAACAICSRRQRGKHPNFVDLVGQRFGQLTVLRKSNKMAKCRGVLWECRCDCGKEVKVASNGLTTGNTKTCANRNVHTKSHGYVGDIPRAFLVAARNTATGQRRRFEITLEYLWQLFLEQEGRCALSGVTLGFTKNRNPTKGRPETTASIDRIDCSKDYVVGNVRWTHKRANIMRSNLTDEVFRDWCFKCATCISVDKDKWDARFMLMAQLVSTFSKDPSTKVGAVIVRADKSVVAQGFNGFPAGMSDAPELYADRETKLSRIVHAEMNALHFSRGSDLRGCCVYTYPLAPCDRCCVHLIQAGVSKFVFPVAKGAIFERWGQMIERTKQYILESGGSFVEV